MAHSNDEACEQEALAFMTIQKDGAVAALLLGDSRSELPSQGLRSPGASSERACGVRLLMSSQRSLQAVKTPSA
jgi:hypothetical protein